MGESDIGGRVEQLNSLSILDSALSDPLSSDPSPLKYSQHLNQVLRKAFGAMVVTPDGMVRVPVNLQL